MSKCRRLAASVVASLSLCGCASPYFVHDPQTFLINRKEVPHVLKSVRCELATYIAADNVRTMLFQAEAATKGIESAREKYPFFDLDITRFGGVSLDLKIQDMLGTDSGTTFNWNRTHDAGAHAIQWNIAPTLGDQSTYEASWAFVVPQDLVTLDTITATQINNDQFDERTPAFRCYNHIPKKPHPPFKDQYAEQDLDGLAAGDYPQYEEFKRVTVNGTMPLAAWLQGVGTTLESTTVRNVISQETPGEIVAGQMTYTFTIQVSAGLDVRYTLVSPLWPIAATGISGSGQQTSTLTLVVNGLQAALTANVSTDTAQNSWARLTLPVIPVTSPNKAAALAPFKSQLWRRGQLLYPPTLRPLGPTNH
jgi:hypothetical protein